MKVGKKTRIGEVLKTSHQMDIVKVEGVRKDPIMGKILKTYKKYKAHDPKNEAKVGDRIEIEECRPVSKTKRWKFLRVVIKSAGQKIELKDVLAELAPKKEEKPAEPVEKKAGE